MRKRNSWWTNIAGCVITRLSGHALDVLYLHVVLLVRVLRPCRPRKATNAIHALVRVRCLHDAVSTNTSDFPSCFHRVFFPDPPPLTRADVLDLSRGPSTEVSDYRSARHYTAHTTDISSGRPALPDSRRRQRHADVHVRPTHAISPEPRRKVGRFRSPSPVPPDVPRRQDRNRVRRDYSSSTRPVVHQGYAYGVSSQPGPSTTQPAGSSRAPVAPRVPASSSQGFSRPDQADTRLQLLRDVWKKAERIRPGLSPDAATVLQRTFHAATLPP